MYQKPNTPFFLPLAWSDRIPLKLPKLEINAKIIKREYTMRILGVLLDEYTIEKNLQNPRNTIYKSRIIDTIEKKFSKSLGMQYESRITNFKSKIYKLYKCIFHSFILIPLTEV